jgi:hypothetical protein
VVAASAQTVTPNAAPPAAPPPPIQGQTVSPHAPVPPSPASPWNGSTQQALETAPPGATLSWTNPDGSVGGSITPGPPFQDGAGQTCREFQQTMLIAGQPQTAFGMACRQPNGAWLLQAAPADLAAGQLPAVAAYGLPPAYYYPEPFYAPLFFGCCFGHRFRGHEHFHHH